MTCLGAYRSWGQETAPGSTPPPAKPAAKTESTPTKPAPSATAKPAMKKSSEPQQLQEVVVSATLDAKASPKSIPASTSTYTSRMLERNQDSNIRDVVHDELDVSTLNSTGGGGPGGNSGAGIQGYNIRGIDGNRILIQSDEIRQPELYTFGGVYAIGRNYQDIDSLQRIEIVKGSASSLYGSDAIGGVVSYVTKDPTWLLDGTDKPFYFDQRENFDSADSEFAHTSTAAVRAGPVDMLVLYTRRDGVETETNGHYAANPLTYNVNNFLGKVAWHVDDSNKLTLAGEWYDFASESQLDNQLGTFLQSSFGPILNRTMESQIENTDRYRLSLRHDFVRPDATPVFDEFYWQAYWQPTHNTEQIDDNYGRSGLVNPGPPPVFGAPVPYHRYFSRDYSNDILGGIIRFTKNLQTGDVAQRISYGFDGSSAQIERNVDGFLQNLATGATSFSFSSAPSALGPYKMPYKEIPDSTVTRLGLYIQNEISFDDEKTVTITPGMRVDYDNLWVKNTPEYTKIVNRLGSGYDEFAFSPKLAILGKITPHDVGYLNFSRGFRAPTTDDLNAVFLNPASVYEVLPNPNLKSETSYSTEIGFRGDYPWLKYEVAAYYNYYQDFINQQTLVGTDPSNGNSIFQSVNLSSAQIYGFTPKIELPFGYWNSSLEGLSLILGAGLTWGDDLEHNQPLDSVDPYKFVSILRYKQSNWGVDLVNTYVVAQDRISAFSSPGNFRPPSYDTVDLVAYYEPTKNARLSVGLYNLTDQKYWLWQDVRGINSLGNPPIGSTVNQIDRFTQPGMNFRTSVAFRF